MERKQLVEALRSYRDRGLTAIKLNGKTEVLQAEYDRIVSETKTEDHDLVEVPEQPKITQAQQRVYKKMEKYYPVPLFSTMMKLYEQDTPKILTTEGLIELGYEIEMKIKHKPVENPTYPSLDWDDIANIGDFDDPNLLRRILAAPGEFGQKRDPEEFDSQFMKIMSKHITIDDVFQTQATAKTYEGIRYFQGICEISGLVRDSFTCRGRTVKYMRTADFLLNTFSDIKRLKKQSSRMTEYFLGLAQLDSPKYQLSRVDYSDYENFGDTGEELPTTYSQLQEYGQRAKSAFLMHSSYEWSQETQTITCMSTGENFESRIGRSVRRPEEPDQIELFLTTKWEDATRGDEAESVSFRLKHPNRE